MAMKWIEGFELGVDEPYFDRLYSVRSGSLAATSNPTGREQGVGAQSDGALDLELTTPALVGSVQNSWITGIGVQFSGAAGIPTGATVFPGLSIKSGVSDQITVDFIDANADCGNFVKIRVSRGATVLGTTTLGMSPLYWYYVEVKATIRTGANGSVEVRVGKGNDATVQWLNLTGINTANTGADGADRMKLRWSNSGGSANPVIYDDWVVMDSTGGANNNFLGPVSVLGLTPNGTGATMNWTLNGGAVSIADAWDDPANSQSTADDDSRASSDTIGQIALASLPNSAYLSNTPVAAVMLRSTLAMDSSGTRTIKHRVRDTGLAAEVDGTPSFVLASTTYTSGYEIFETNPNGGAAWSKTALDNLEIGVHTTA